MDNLPMAPRESMEITPARTLREAPITLKNYNERVLMFAQASSLDEFPTISPGMSEFTAWGRYFDLHLGGQPWAYRALRGHQIEAMTVPTQWPEWFDSSYTGTDL